ncbi:MAG: hypothetical protein AAF609_26870 [Cyanobacteria bacterium P01_C01_bin.120]
MAGIRNIFARANYRCRERAYQRWHQGQCKKQILRSQIGFAEVSPSRPAACVGCGYYHGHAYGTQRDQRIPLICGMHPYGWQEELPCPDWQADSKSLDQAPVMLNIRSSLSL